MPLLTREQMKAERKPRITRWTQTFVNNFQQFVPEFRDKETHYLEIGVFLGNTSKWMLENVLLHPQSRLFGIDPWDFELVPAKWYPRTDEGRVAWQKVMDNLDQMEKNYSPKVEWFKGYSQNVLRDQTCWLSSAYQYFDIIYVDGHHTIPSVLRDWVLSWPLLKDGGIMIFDDYEAMTSTEVKESVDLILKGLGKRTRRPFKREAKYDLLFKNNQVGIRKIRE